MGWSCASRASETLQRHAHACAAATGSQNLALEGGGRLLMLEVSRKEHDDGAITGSLYACRDEAGHPLSLATYRTTGRIWTVRAGSFRIEPDGSVSRGPRSLKAAASGPCLDCAGTRMVEAWSPGDPPGTYKATPCPRCSREAHRAALAQVARHGVPA